MVILMSFVITGTCVAVVVSRFWDKDRAVNEVESFARKRGMPLRTDITERLARRRRWSYLGGTIVAFATACVAQAAFLSDGGSRLNAKFTALMTALCGLGVVTGCLIEASLSSGNGERRRVAHLAAFAIRDLFTRWEWIALTAGVAVAVGGGAVALDRDSAGGWWWVWCAGLAANLVIWSMLTHWIMERPARASDDLELAWDDILRFDAARAATFGVVWLPALGALLADSAVFDKQAAAFVAAAIAATIGLTVLFRRGNDRWRRAWESPSR